MPTGNTQQIINYGASANDGQGDPLRTAFIKTEDNFDNIWLAGPVGSNVRITNNTIGILDTNGNLILSPNGIGVIQTNNHVIPRFDRTYDLGTANLNYRSVYANTFIGNATLGNTSTITIGVGNLHILGGTNGYVLQTDGTGNLTWTAQTGGSGNGTPGGANTQVQYNNAGAFGGTAGFTFNNVANALAVPMVDTSTIYHFGGVVVENADLTHGATAALILPPHTGNLANIQLNNIYGNIVLQSGAAGNTTASWIFNNDGTLTVPLQPSGPSNKIKYGLGNLVAWLDGGWVIGEYNGTDYGTEGVRISPGIEGNVEVNLPSNQTANVNPLQLVNYVGNVVIGTGNNVTNWSWKFDNTGNLVLPDLANTSINYANGQPYGGGANTGNVTFDNINIIGDGNLHLQPDPAQSSAYLDIYLTTGPDIHIAGNGENLILGRDEAANVSVNVDGSVVITGVDGNAHNWKFGADGNLTVPRTINSSLSGGFPFGAIITGVTTGNPTVIVTLDSDPFPDAVTGQVTITGVKGATQANGTRYYRAVEPNAFQLFNNEACTVPTSGTDWTAYSTGGFAYSPEYKDLELKGDNVNIRTGDSIFQFTPTGDIQMPGGAYSDGYGRLLTNNGYTTLLSYGTDEEHGGPELDWSNAADKGNVFGNSDVLRNTLYLNENGLYIGLNQNGNANALNASWQFDRFGALNIPAGSANTTASGQILSNNENGFINLDVQFGVDPGQEGGVRLGTGASKPVDIWASSSQQWRFDSDGSLTVPGVIKSIGSYVYRGFYAVLNQISGDDPSINQIVLSRSSSISGSNPTTDTDDDNFIVTGINGSNITAIVNLYGTNTSTPLDTEDLFSFIRNYIDVVLYNGNTQRTSISDIQTAFATNEVSLLEENFAPGTIVDNMKFNAIQAIFQVNSFTHTGSGTDAVFLFDLDEPIGAIDYSTADWNYNDCVVLGTGYQVGDTITVPGTELGGATPADDMTITVDGIDGSGGITSFTTTGTMSQASYEQSFVKHYIYDGVSDIQDQGNFLGTDISRCVFTAYTDANANLIVTSVTSGALYPYMTFYEPDVQTYPMVLWQTDGVTEGGTGTYVCGGYDTISSNLPSRTYTAYGIPYAVGETLLGADTWGGGTYGSMVGSNGNGIFSMVCLDGSASIVSYAGNTGSDGDGTKAAISQFAIGAEAQPLNLVSNNSTWEFGTDGNLTVPGNINAAATGSFPINATISAITTGVANVYVTLSDTVFPGPVTGKVAISGVLGTDQANGTWWFQASEVNEIQLYTDSEFTTPANGTTWLPYLGGGTAASVTYDNLVIGAGVLTLGNPNRQWTLYEDGNIVTTHNTASIIGVNGLAVEVVPGNSLTNVINVPVDQTFTGSWSTATYSANSGTGRIDIVGAQNSLRRFVQLYMQNANQGTALVTVNDSSTELVYNGFEYIGNTFTIYVAQSPGVTPITVTTMRLDAVMRNVMELNDDNNQLNIESYSGWSVNITSGYQGDVNINAGDDIFINAGDKTTSDATGGQIDINAGNGGAADTQDPAGPGGDINLRSGDGGVASNVYGAGNGGTTFVSGGQGGLANATGSHNAGIGGSLVLYAGNAGGNDGNISLGQEGGNVEIQAGSASGGLDGGYVSITAGQGGTGYGSGNIRLTTENSGHDTSYNLVLDNTGNLTLPTILTGEGIDEQAILRSQRKIIPAFHYSAAINGATPTVVYTASSSNISSLKMTISMTHAGLGQEMFDISAISAGANVLYSVSNRLNGTGQPDTTVSVDYNGSNILAVTLTVGSGTTTSYVTYDSTEFGYQVD